MGEQILNQTWQIKPHVYVLVLGYVSKIDLPVWYDCTRVDNSKEKKQYRVCVNNNGLNIVMSFTLVLYLHFGMNLEHFGVFEMINMTLP